MIIKHAITCLKKIITCRDHSANSETVNFAMEVSVRTLSLKHYNRNLYS